MDHWVRGSTLLHGCIDHDHVGGALLQEPAVLLHVLGHAADGSVAEEVLAPPRACAHRAARRVRHFSWLAGPTADTAQVDTPASTALATEVPPAAVTQDALTHAQWVI